MAHKPKGVVSVNGRLYIDYYDQTGRRRRRATGLTDTPRNRKAAERQRAAVLHAIEQGEYAPETGKRKERLTTLGALLTLYKEYVQSEVAPSAAPTRIAIIDRHLLPHLADYPCDEVSPMELRRWREAVAAIAGPKHANVCLQILSMAFNFGIREGVCTHNPASKVGSIRLDEEESADPFTRVEIAQLMNTHYPRNPQLPLYAQLGCFTGLRPSELFGLAWEDVNFERKTLSVNRNFNRAGMRVPKNARSIRTVDLNNFALDALYQLYELTGNRQVATFDVLQRDNRTTRREKLHLVFIGPRTGEPYTSKSFNKIWRTFLARAGVRYRSPYQTRHTFASQMLTMGLPKDWIAAQMGHKGTTMLETIYAKWIREDSEDFAARVAKEFAKRENSEI